MADSSLTPHSARLNISFVSCSGSFCLAPFALVCAESLSCVRPAACFRRSSCPQCRDGRFSPSGAGASSCPLPDSVNVDGKSLDLVVQRLLWDAQKRSGRLNITLLSPQRVLDDRSLDVLQLSRQRHIRRTKSGLVNRFSIKDAKHETIGDVAQFARISRPRIG